MSVATLLACVQKRVSTASSASISAASCAAQGGKSRLLASICCTRPCFHLTTSVSERQAAKKTVGCTHWALMFRTKTPMRSLAWARSQVRKA